MKSCRLKLTSLKRRTYFTGTCNCVYFNLMCTFHSVISSGVQLLVANLESGCDAALVSMTKVCNICDVLGISLFCVVCLAAHRDCRRPE